VLGRLAALREAGVIFLLMLVVGITWVREPRFLESTSLNTILLLIPLLIVIGIGQMPVIVTRGIDVSVGSIVGLAGMTAGLVFRANPGLNAYAGAAIAIAAGAVLGAVNGGLIVGLRVPPIIATLGTLSAYRGLTFIISRSEQIEQSSLPDAMTGWAKYGPLSLGGVTFSWLLTAALGVALLGHLFLRSTRTGRDVYAIGSNPEAARLRGVPVSRTTFLVYVLSGALSGLAGIMYASKFGFINPGSAGAGLELTVIAAVVIGGTNVLGGSGTVAGVLLGSLLLGAISVALSVVGMESDWQAPVYGLVILVSVIVDSAIHNRLRRATEGGPIGRG
jgi:rhamnose transport system permease protein